jgi:uncharacterized protein
LEWSHSLYLNIHNYNVTGWLLRGWIGLIIIGVMGTLYEGVYREPNEIVIHHQTIQDPALAKVLKDRVVVQLSDLHLQSIGRHEERLLTLLDQLAPDLLLLTGDYVRWKENYDPALQFLARLRAHIGIWAVMGDYDYSDSRRSCLFCHEQGSPKPPTRHRVHFLRNACVEISIGEQKLRLIGIDRDQGSFHPQGRPKSIPLHGPALVLCHNPLTYDLVHPDQPVVLLAGDTHGGQIPLPSFLWSWIGYEKNARFNAGLFKAPFKQMYVSRGLGISHVPFRLFCPPEVVVLHFVE